MNADKRGFRLFYVYNGYISAKIRFSLKEKMYLCSRIINAASACSCHQQVAGMEGSAARSRFALAIPELSYLSSGLFRMNDML